MTSFRTRETSNDTKLQQIFDLVLSKDRGAVIMKRDIKDAFRNIPVAPHDQWLLAFSWNDLFYKETCPFLWPFHCTVSL